MGLQICGWWQKLDNQWINKLINHTFSRLKFYLVDSRNSKGPTKVGVGSLQQTMVIISNLFLHAPGDGETPIFSQTIQTVESQMKTICCSFIECVLPSLMPLGYSAWNGRCVGCIVPALSLLLPSFPIPREAKITVEVCRSNWCPPATPSTEQKWKPSINFSIWSSLGFCCSAEPWGLTVS